MTSQRQDNAEKAYEYIRERILNQSYKPGERLIAQEVAAAVGLSRTPIREALGQLERNGLVEKTGWGFTVRAMTLQDIEDLFDVREILEVEAARKALAHADDSWVSLLEEIVRESGLHVAEGRPIESVRTARRVYVSISERAKNQVLSDMLASINDRIQLVGGSLVARLPWRAEEIYQENKDIVAAYARRDERRLIHTVRDHIRRSRALHLTSKEKIRAA